MTQIISRIPTPLSSATTPLPCHTTQASLLATAPAPRENPLMEEIEKFFKCPYCHQKISMLLDLSLDDTQSYIEDCEVCCRPIQVTFTVMHGQLSSFIAQGAAG